MRILGISALYHDSAAAMIEDGEILSAVQEERFTRKKHDPEFPDRAIEYCLSDARCRPEISTTRVLREAVPQVRTPARDISGLRTARTYELRHIVAPVAQGKVVPKKLDRRFLKEHWGKNINLDGRLLFSEHHLSSCRVGVLPLSVRGSSRPDDGRRGRMDDNLRLRSEKVTSCRSTRKLHFPHSLGCFTPPSPTTPASRSIPASTRSWGWRPMASPNTPT